VLPWDGVGDYREFARRSGIPHDLPEMLKPIMKDEFLALHLLPHFRQAAGVRGVSLEEYVKLISVPENFQQERDWLRLPYTLSYVDTSHYIAGEFEANAHVYYKWAALRKSLMRLMVEKRGGGDFGLEIKSCGCGSGGEAYGLAVLAHVLAGEVGGDWNIRVTGYSINPDKLERAERGKVVIHMSDEEAASEQATNPFFRFARLENVGGSSHHSQKEYTLILDEGVRDCVRFEWMDLLDTRHLQRLRDSPSDLLALLNVFKLYEHSNAIGADCSWWSGSFHAALDSIIGSIRPGGLFLADRNIDQAPHYNVTWRREQGLDLPLTLYFTGPGLTEVPDPEPEKSLKVFPTSDAEAETMRGFVMTPELWWPVLDRYGDEIRAHGGRIPSGVYVKEKSKQ